MRVLIVLLPLLASASALISTSKIKDGYDSVYSYVQTARVFIDEKLQSEKVNSLEVAMRPGPEKLTIIGHIKNLGVDYENVTEAEKRVLADIESPFKVDLNEDGTPNRIWGKENEDRFSLRTKDSVLKLLLQNTTTIESYLDKVDSKIFDEGCEKVTKVNKLDKKIVFEVETKVLDCNNKSALSGVVGENSQFKLFYHLDQEDKKLVEAKSVIDIIYLTSVSSRFETIQNLVFVRADGLKDDIDISVFKESHTPKEIDELWNTPPPPPPPAKTEENPAPETPKPEVPVE